MRIQDVIQKTGVTKKTIHFYIDKGLMTPKRDTNGYFHFDQADIERVIFIRNLKEIGLPLKDISAVIEHPDTLIFILTNHRKKLLHRCAEENWKFTRTKDIIDRMTQDPSGNFLGSEITSYSQLTPTDMPIDEIDADLIAYHFFGNFMRNLEMTEYRNYLYDQIKKYLITHQTKDMILFRNYLYSLNANLVNKEYFMTRGNYYEELLYLQPDQYDSYIQKYVSVIRKNLRNNVWILNWRKVYPLYIRPATHYYDGEVNRYMCELSPEYNIYHSQARIVAGLFYDYLTSEEGNSLYMEIKDKLDGLFDLESCNHTEVFGLYLAPF